MNAYEFILQMIEQHPFVSILCLIAVTYVCECVTKAACICMRGWPSEAVRKDWGYDIISESSTENNRNA